MANTLHDAMAAAGLAPAKPIDLNPDGKIHRYRVTGDKGGSNNGWYVLHDGPMAFGAFGSWRNSESHTWREASTKPLTPAERADITRRTKAMWQAQAIERKAVQEAAQAKALRMWRMARPATHAHPYLAKKQVNSYGLRQLREMLLVPARDHAGVLHTLQFIMPDGSKRFLTGGRISGCYVALGRVGDTLLLAENQPAKPKRWEPESEITTASLNQSCLASRPNSADYPRHGAGFRASFPLSRVLMEI